MSAGKHAVESVHTWIKPLSASDTHLSGRSHTVHGRPVVQSYGQ